MKVGTNTVRVAKVAIKSSYIRVSSITLAVIAALNPGGVVVVVISAGGFEVLTQPSHSLAENSLGPVAWLLTFFCRIRLPRTHTHTDQM
jgi:hypothetical protein